MKNFEQQQLKRTVFTRYSLAILLFLFALILRFKIAPAEAGLPFLTFYPTMVVIFYLCGIRPGIVCAILSAITAYYFFTPPFFSFVPSTIGVFTVTTFAISAYIIGLIIHKMQRALVLLKENEQRRGY